MKTIRGSTVARTRSMQLLIPFPISLRDLEKAVEDLSELLESPIEASAISTLRQRMTDKTVSNTDSSY